MYLFYVEEVLDPSEPLLLTDNYCTLKDCYLFDKQKCEAVSMSFAIVNEV